MPAKKTPTKKPRGKKPIGLTSAIGPKATTILVICVMAGGMAVAARQREQAAKAKAADEAMMMAADATPSVMAAPAKTSKSRDVVPAVSTPASTTEPAVVKTSGTTLTGCLERTDDGFRLKDTEGENAPKSRSWKSGFLKKGSAAITVTDPSRSLRLANQVGRRVTISGTLTNRELRAGAIQVSGTCK